MQQIYFTALAFYENEKNTCQNLSVEYNPALPSVSY